jgi:aminopeptidase C
LEGSVDGDEVMETTDTQSTSFLLNYLLFLKKKEKNNYFLVFIIIKLCIYIDFDSDVTVKKRKSSSSKGTWQNFHNPLSFCYILAFTE